MKSSDRNASRRAALRRLGDRILELSELPALIRCLTEELPHALGVQDATLLLWDRRLEVFQGLALTTSGAVRTIDPQVGAPEGGKPPRWLLSEGRLMETAKGGAPGVLMPLLSRSGLTGTLLLGAVSRLRRPISDAEAPLVSRIASRAALALENHAYQKELIASERLAALGTVAGMLAHDFRGPITVIRGYAETLLETGVAEQEISLRAQQIVDAADRLERMTQETLDFARGAATLVARPRALGLLLTELATSVEQELPGLTVVRRFHPSLETIVTVDVDKLRRAVINIAANARDAMGGRGVFTIGARVVQPESPTDPPAHLVLELADEGPGVSQEIRERLFEPFVSKGKKGGTGLGLAVARRFVLDHGGSIKLLPAAEPPQRGARFRITLPVVATDASDRAR